MLKIDAFNLFTNIKKIITSKQNYDCKIAIIKPCNGLETLVLVSQ